MHTAKSLRGNLLADLPAPTTGESFADLVRHRNLVIERIVSSDSPEPVLYDQEQDEWVILLEGRASLEVAGEVAELAAGDWIFIPAHTPHRLIAASPLPRCLWLAVHLFPAEAVV
jgi:cupin 2 domain-containing protein